MSKFIIETAQIVYRTYAIEAESKEEATELYNDLSHDPIDGGSGSEEIFWIREKKVS